LSWLSALAGDVMAICNTLDVLIESIQDPDDFPCYRTKPTKTTNYRRS
jgi:hypothetical protein